MKILLGVLSGVFVLLCGLFFLVNVVYEPKAEDLVFPQGELSDSIFVGQNNEYTKNESLGKTHEFQTVPYMVDVPEVKGATIGSGCVYEVGGGMFIYVTEFDDMTQVDDAAKYNKLNQMQDILASQFPAALLINYIPEETKVTAEVSGDGFINGFTAHYLADSIGITDGAQTVNAGLLGYILDIDKKGFEGRHLYVAVGSQNPTNESLSQSALVLSAVMQTVRFDDAMYEKMTKDMNLGDDELAEENAEGTDGPEEGGENMENEEDVPSENDLGDNEDDVYVSTFYSEESDARLQVNVKWDNVNYDAILELFLPGGAEFCEPLNQDGTSAQFVLANAPSGEYTLRIKTYAACGTISDGLSGDDSNSYSSDFNTDNYEVTDVNTDASSSQGSTVDDE